MSLVLCSTVVRKTKDIAHSGQVFLIDWSNDPKIVSSMFTELPKTPVSELSNKRGGLRGATGIKFAQKDCFWFTNYDTAFKYTLNFKKVDEIYNEFFAGIHQIWLDGKHLYVTSTMLDRLYKVNTETKVVDLALDLKEQQWLEPLLEKRKKFLVNKGCKQVGLTFRVDDYNLILNREKSKINVCNWDYKSAPGVGRVDLTHLNNVQIINSKTYINLKDVGAFVELPSKVLLDYPIEYESHDTTIMPDGNFVMNCSGDGLVRVWNSKCTLKKEILLTNKICKIYGEHYRELVKPSPWNQGFGLLPNGNFVVGHVPAGLLELDTNGNVVKHLNLASEQSRDNKVHGIDVRTF